MRLAGGGCAPLFALDGVVADDAIITHPADCVIAWTQAALPTALTLIRFRYTSAANTVQIQVNPVGNLILQKIVAGSTTTVRSVATVVSAGARVVVVASDTNIKAYVNGVLTTINDTVTEHATVQNGICAVIESGNVSNLKTWTLACRTAEGV